MMANCGSRRIEWLDIYKGIAIILVVVGHLSVGQTMKNFIYSFHMPLFLFASGILYKKRVCLKEFFRRDILKVFKAYLFFTVIWMTFELLWNLVVLNEPFCHRTWQYLFTLAIGNGNITGISIGVQWYLSMYITIRLMYEIISHIDKRFLEFSIVVLSYIVGTLFLNGNAMLPWCLSSAFTGLIFFWFGVKLFPILAVYIQKYQRLNLFRILIPLTCFGVTFLLCGNNSMSKNSYDSPIRFLITVLMGILGTIAISLELEQFGLTKRILTYYGLNSLYVMGWHSELRVVLIYGLGIIIHSGLVKNLLTLIISLICCIPLCRVSDKVLKPQNHYKQ